MTRSINARLRKLEAKRQPGPPPLRFIWVDADDPDAKSKLIRHEGEGTCIVLRWLRQDEPSPEFDGLGACGRATRSAEQRLRKLEEARSRLPRRAHSMITDARGSAEERRPLEERWAELVSPMRTQRRSLGPVAWRQV